jgi:hypothetical protein
VEAIGRVDFPMADVYPIMDSDDEVVVVVVARGSRPSEVDGRQGMSLAVADKVRRCCCCCCPTWEVMGCIKLEQVGRGIREVRTLKSMSKGRVRVE